jgi:toxin-antitoxin system PIN domain toxin
MWLPDVNVLLAASQRQAPYHAVARQRLEAAFGSGAPVGLAWVALLGFLRLTTNGRVFPVPMPVDEALRIVDGWVSHPGAMVLHPGPRHAALLGALLIGAGTAGNLTTDAHLAAIAIEHGATVASFDRDFSRFAGLRFEHLHA